MSTAKVLRRGMAVLTLLGLILAAGWYRAFPDTETGSALVPLSAKAMQSRIAELAACPSPLERLGIDRPRPRLMVGEDEIDLVIPATGDEDGSMVRFTLDPRSDGSHTRVGWRIDPERDVAADHQAVKLLARILGEHAQAGLDVFDGAGQGGLELSVLTVLRSRECFRPGQGVGGGGHSG